MCALANSRVCRATALISAAQFKTKSTKAVVQDGEWVVMEGRFFGVMVCNVPFVSTTVCMAPMARVRWAWGGRGCGRGRG